MITGKNKAGQGLILDQGSWASENGALVSTLNSLSADILQNYRGSHPDMDGHLWRQVAEPLGYAITERDEAPEFDPGVRY